MSDSTNAESHWATSSGPRSPAASTAKRWPSTRRTPAASGSTPRRAHARSRNDSDGTTSTLDARVGAQQLHGALGHERRTGHGVDDLAVLGGRGDQSFDDRGVDVVERVGDRRTRRRTIPPPRRRSPPDGGGCAGTVARSRHWRSRGCRRREQVGTGRTEPDDDDPARHSRQVTRRRREPPAPGPDRLRRLERNGGLGWSWWSAPPAARPRPCLRRGRRCRSGG